MMQSHTLCCRFVWIFDMKHQLWWALIASYFLQVCVMLILQTKILSFRATIMLFYWMMDMLMLTNSLQVSCPCCLCQRDMEKSSELFPILLLNSSIPSILQNESLPVHSLRKIRFHHKQGTCTPSQAWTFKLYLLILHFHWFSCLSFIVDIESVILFFYWW